MFRNMVLRILVCLPLACGLAPANAASISYTAVDLTDVSVGQDLWQYRYAVSGSFVAFGGFEVQFDPALYAQLEDPAPAVNPDWFIVTTQPDTGLGTLGLYTATAMTGAPSLLDPFTVSFVWLGSGTPGAQPFGVFDDSFSTVARGVTSPAGVSAVPEPETYALLAGGLLLLGMVRRFKSGRQTA